MKKLFTVIISIISMISLFAQTIVSTETENRKVILEEFTAINCRWCPVGADEANRVKETYPDDVILISIHYGYLASPNSGQPDYRCEDGISIGDFLGVSNFPNAIINRHGELTNEENNYWLNAAKDIIAQNSYVNVGVEAELNDETRELSIHIELYYTSESTSDSNMLNIALLQENTIGIQKMYDNSYNNSYLHKHRLVDMITDNWGFKVNNTSSGSFIDTTIYYTVPNDYNSIPADLNNLTVVAFVAESKKEIVSGAQYSFVKEPSLLLLDNDGNDISNTQITVNGTFEDFELDYSLDVKNISHDTVLIKVKKAEITIIDDTENYFCYGTTCYPPQTYESESINMNPSENTLFSCDYKHNEKSGASSIRYTFFNANNTSDTVAIEVTFNATATSNILNNSKDYSVGLFPNPVIDNAFSIKYKLSNNTNSIISIYNMQGVKIEEKALNKQTGIAIFDCLNYNSGIYFYTFKKDGFIIKLEKLIIEH